MEGETPEFPLVRAMKFPVGKLTAEQDRQVWFNADACRDVWNRWLEELNALRAPIEQQRLVSLAELDEEMSKAERTAEIKDIYEAYYKDLRTALAAYAGSDRFSETKLAGALTSQLPDWKKSNDPERSTFWSSGEKVPLSHADSGSPDADVGHAAA